MVSLKMQLLAATFNLLSHNLTVVGKQDEICANAPRMEVIAEAIDAGVSNNLCSNNPEDKACWAGSSKKLAWIVFTLGEFESGYKENIHAGVCSKFECDPVFKKLANGQKQFLYHQARTNWQLHKTNFISQDEWNGMVGTSLESTTIATTIVAKEISHFKDTCGSDVGAISMYATGRMCDWYKAKHRLKKAEEYISRTSNEEWVNKNIEKYNECLPQQNIYDIILASIGPV